MNFTKITVETLVSAPAQKVWEHWTKPEHITEWNFASDDWHCTKADNELISGGRFSSTMASKDGKMSFDFEGTYEEIIDQQKIAYVLADERRVTVTFEEIDGKTQVIETFDAENINSIELQQSGWQAILDNFKKYVEAR